jgi:hypothetical protein
MPACCWPSSSRWASSIEEIAMKITLNFQDADTFYEQLLDAHAGLDRDQSELLNARLILLLANQIGDARALSDCLSAAVEMPR